LINVVKQLEIRLVFFLCFFNDRRSVELWVATYIEQTDRHSDISGFLTNSTLADTKYGMTQMERTKWNFFMYTSYTAPTTVDFCAAWCRLLRHSSSYPKCNVFVFDGTNCYVGVITKTAAYNTGPAGISDVYYDKGKQDLYIHGLLTFWCLRGFFKF
jgi:hypothetical protein